VDIATGQPEGHPSLLPLDSSGNPAIAPPTMTAGQQTPAMQGAVFDTTGDQAGRLGGYESDIRAAQAAGMGAENDRRGHFHQDILPVGAAYGDLMALPEVPGNAVPAASSYGYSGTGDEPLPAG
jgi:hypothetical protein